MPNSTVKARPVISSGPAQRERENGDARREALEWLANQLRWDRTLENARARSARR
jgi:hypothetical protein